MKRSLYWLAGALVVSAALAILMVSLRPASNRYPGNAPDSSPKPVGATPPSQSPDRTPPTQIVAPSPSPAATLAAGTPSPTPFLAPRTPAPYYTATPAPEPSLSTPSPGSWPTPTASPAATAAADPSADVDAVLQQLDWGQLAFDVPERLRENQTALVHLIVSRTQSGEQLTATLRLEAVEPVRIEPAQIRISDKMQARLVGSAFDIQPITPEEPRLVGRSQPTEWEWEIRPRQAGKQKLHLTLNAIVNYKNSDTLHPVRTFDRIIEVEVEPSFLEHWLWPVAGLAALTALAGGAAVLYRRRHRPAVRPSGGGEIDLFISYARHDQAQALALVGRLQRVGYKAWIDQRGIDGAMLWAQEISHAIRRCKVCVLFASAASFASANVAREVSLVSEERKPILPLFLEPVEVPAALRLQLAGIHYLTLYYGGAEDNFQMIVRALDRLGVARPVTADGR